MNKEEVLRRIREVGVVPVVRARSAEEAVRAVEAIKAGGITLLEITMTVPRAVDLIEQLSARYGDEAVVGAGTVLDPETARACVMAGAQFVVSPSLDVRTIELCRRYGVAVMPGALTPTEVVTAWQAGADMVKVFPCGALGPSRWLVILFGAVGTLLRFGVGEVVAIGVVNTFGCLRALREHEVVAHAVARRFGVVLAYGAVNLPVHLRRLFQVFGPLDGLAAHVEEYRRHHVHQRGEDAVAGGCGHGLVEAHVVEEELLR